MCIYQHMTWSNDVMTNVGVILCSCVPYPIHGVNVTTVYVSLCMVQGPLSANELVSISYKMFLRRRIDALNYNYVHTYPFVIKSKTLWWGGETQARGDIPPSPPHLTPVWSPGSSSMDGGLSTPVFVLLLNVLCVLCRTRSPLWCMQLEEVTQMWFKYYWVDKMWTSTWEIRFVHLNGNGHLLSHMSLHVHVAVGKSIAQFN